MKWQENPNLNKLTCWISDNIWNMQWRRSIGVLGVRTPPEFRHVVFTPIWTPQIFPENMRFLPANGVHLQSIYLLTWRLKQCLQFNKLYCTSLQKFNRLLDYNRLFATALVYFVQCGWRHFVTLWCRFWLWQLDLIKLLCLLFASYEYDVIKLSLSFLFYIFVRFLI